MQTLPAPRARALALACVLAPVTHAGAADLLTGIPRLACEATLCLSSSLRPGQCSPSLDHYFDIKKYNKHGLDWSATISARRSFLSRCPASGDAGMTERIDAISHGAGKCDAEFLNQNYAATAYKWRKREYGGDSGQTVYDVHPLPTVTRHQLPTRVASIMRGDKHLGRSKAGEKSFLSWAGSDWHKPGEVNDDP